MPNRERATNPKETTVSKYALNCRATTALNAISPNPEYMIDHAFQLDYPESSSAIPAIGLCRWNHNYLLAVHDQDDPMHLSTTYIKYAPSNHL